MCGYVANVYCMYVSMLQTGRQGTEGDHGVYDRFIGSLRNLLVKTEQQQHLREHMTSIWSFLAGNARASPYFKIKNHFNYFLYCVFPIAAVVCVCVCFVYYNSIRLISAANY